MPVMQRMQPGCRRPRLLLTAHRCLCAAFPALTLVPEALLSSALHVTARLMQEAETERTPWEHDSAPSRHLRTLSPDASRSVRAYPMYAECVSSCSSSRFTWPVSAAARLW